MDVLNPPLYHFQGRWYRINDPETSTIDSKAPRGDNWDEYPSNYECSNDEPCDEDNDQYDIVTTENGRYKTAFHVARIYFAPIIGSKGSTKKRLEDETKTIIRVPRQPTEHDILITGSTRRGVVSARRRIEMMVCSLRKKQQATHFLSIRMISPPVKQRFLQFKQEVLERCGARGVDESIFQDADKLHLTLCTLVLTDNVERALAADVLKRCKTDVIDPLMEGNNITVLLSGVEYMNDDPSEVDVLYAKVCTDDILHVLVNDVVNYCADAGLVDKQYDRVKLHVTIMNTLFRNNKEAGKRETFNAQPILEMFHDYEFGEVVIDEIQLSTRFSTSKTDGFYQSSCQVSLLI